MIGATTQMTEITLKQVEDCIEAFPPGPPARSSLSGPIRPGEEPTHRFQRLLPRFLHRSLPQNKELNSDRGLYPSSEQLQNIAVISDIVNIENMICIPRDPKACRRTDPGNKMLIFVKRILESLKKVGFVLRWLPIIGSVTLMAVLFFVSAFSFAQSKTANSWRDHTYIVLTAAETFPNDLFRIQQDSRNYVFTGQAAVLKTFEQSVRSASQQLSQLKLLTGDNPAQEERLSPISSDLGEVIAFAQQLVDTRNTYGLQAVDLFKSDDQRMASTNRSLVDLQAFTDVERRLAHSTFPKS